MKHGFKTEEVMDFIRNVRGMGYSYGDIAQSLNLMGYSSPEGKKFYSNTVRRLLEDPFDA